MVWSEVYLKSGRFASLRTLSIVVWRGCFVGVLEAIHVPLGPRGQPQGSGRLLGDLQRLPEPLLAALAENRADPGWQRGRRRGGQRRIAVAFHGNERSVFAVLRVGFGALQARFPGMGPQLEALRGFRRLAVGESL